MRANLLNANNVVVTEIAETRKVLKGSQYNSLQCTSETSKLDVINASNYCMNLPPLGMRRSSSPGD